MFCNYEGLRSHANLLHFTSRRLVLGSRDKAAQAHLFCEKDCDLHQAIESLRISERTQEQLRSISGTEEEDIHAINSAKKGQQRSSTKKPYQREATRKQMMWNYCGGQHRPDKLLCPAYGKLCRYCNKPNHFQSMCRQNQQKQQTNSRCTKSQRGRKRTLMSLSIR